jgi:uncharacterized protein (DUF305 family)
MSKKLIESQQSNPQLSSLVNNIITSQQNEINLMKKLET